MEDQTILIIEDNKANMKLFSCLLQGTYTVIEAGDATTGIQFTKQHKPDLILMDIQLPDMDGLTATRTIKADPGFSHIKIIALTAHAMEGDEEKILGAGCDGYISKPIDTRAFLEQIADVLNGNIEGKCKGGNILRHKDKILIVDDQEVNVKVLASKLNHDEYEIISAFSGKEAIQEAKEKLPDVILLDIMMPDMDGYEVTRYLKNDPVTKPIPIIMVSALYDEESKVKGREVGAEEFINKPVDTKELLSRVNSTLQMKRYREQLTIRMQSEAELVVPGSQEESIQDITYEASIMLVEDNEKDAKLIQSYLNGQPYRVIHVKNGEEAIACVQHEKIDLILLDILLPSIDGFEVCRQLKEKEETKNIQIMVITCLKDLENRVKGMKLGADDYLIKPVRRQELLARVSIFLEKKAHIDKLSCNYVKDSNSSIIDGLTQTYNHSYLKRFLEHEIKRSQRHSYPLSLFMISIDNFMYYNFTIGHAAGDIILKEVATIIKRNIRETDLVARYEGEKFALVMPYSSREDVIPIVERIRKHINEHTFPEETSNLKGNLTVSMGGSFGLLAAQTSEDLIKDADHMLYKAKQEGKDRICI